MARILVVDDEDSIRSTFEVFLTDEGHEVAVAGSHDEALSRAGGDFDMVLADIVLGGRSGIDLLRAFREKGLSCPVVMITGYPTVQTAAEAVRLGAFDYIMKPVTQEMLLHSVRLCLEHKRVLGERDRYRANLEATFLSVKDGLVTVDGELRLLQVNEAARGICGYGDGALGKVLGSWPLSCDGRCVKALGQTIATRQPTELFRVACRHEDRRPLLVSLSVWPLFDRQGAFSGAVMAIRDETRLASLEHDLGDRRKFHGLVGRSRGMQQVYSLVEALANLDTTVLITGETGTGKELVAEALHFTGSRAERPLVRVNCSALTETLLESELFGHVKGAFTGAVSDKVGRFERADGGTMFLDEIADISPRVQASLLRVLQEKEFDRVGDATPLKVDVRVVAATNKDLRARVEARQFREDLFYRLKVIEIRLPPLRERREDLPLLVEHFLNHYSASFGKTVRGLSEDTWNLFRRYPWPGNVRELRHTVEHAVILCGNDTVITMEHLPAHLHEFAAGDKSDEEMGYRQLLQALERAEWNKAEAARMLGIDRKTLYRKLKRFRISDGKG